MEVIGAIIGFLFLAFLALMVIGWLLSLGDDDWDDDVPTVYDPIAEARARAESIVASARQAAQQRIDAAVRDEQQRAATAIAHAHQLVRTKGR